jgi:hypothetical protein
LGLKGSLNEYELDLLRQRSVEARREKARRGELLVTAAVGYVKTEEEHWEKDPDRRVQQAILSVFGKFLELGTVRQTLLWFLEHGLQLPVYTQQGETCWKRPTYATIYRILTNPIYGGAYAYGKTEHTLHYENGEPRRGARLKPKEQWLALIPNSHEGYVSWEQHQQIRQAISENVRGGEHSGLVQGGAALLPGLLRCRRCGRKLTVLYTGNHHNVLRYECRRGLLDNGEPRCIGFGGMPVDEALAQEVLRVVQPAGVEAAILASEEEARKRDEVLEALGRDLEAARYAAQRAQKQYDAADPENRLVADELERRWNQALQRVQEIERRIEQHVHGQGKTTTATREEYEELAAKLETVWNCPDTDIRLKKRIVRTLIHEVVVDVDAEAGELILVVHWKGGVHTELRLPRRRRGQNSKQTSKEIVHAVKTLAQICSDEVIAGALNRNGLLTGRGNRWTKEGVTSLRSHHQIPCYSNDRRQTEGWMNLTEAADTIGVSARTLRLAVERGEIAADHPLDDGPWVFNRCELEKKAAVSFVERVRSGKSDPAIPNSDQRNFGFSTT